MLNRDTLRAATDTLSAALGEMDRMRDNSSVNRILCDSSPQTEMLWLHDIDDYSRAFIHSNHRNVIVRLGPRLPLIHKSEMKKPVFRNRLLSIITLLIMGVSILTMTFYHELLGPWVWLTVAGIATPFVYRGWVAAKQGCYGRAVTEAVLYVVFIVTLYLIGRYA